MYDVSDKFTYWYTHIYAHNAFTEFQMEMHFSTNTKIVEYYYIIFFPSACMHFYVF